MKKAFFLLFVFVILSSMLSGCNSMQTTSTCTVACPANVAPVSLTMTDDPPAGVSVLLFQVSLTAATLQPTTGAPVSLLPINTLSGAVEPIPIDVTQLQALSAFLSTINVPGGSYSSLSLTFANPQLTILNQSDASLGSSCAVGSVCQLTPTVDNSATITLSSSPFPVTVGGLSPLGFLVDFHLNTIIQPDLSINLQAANGVTIKQLQPPSTPTAPPQFGSVVGSVIGVTAADSQFTLTTPDGRTFTVSATSATSYDDFPTSACATAGFSCLAQGQIVEVQVSSLGISYGGILTAAQITYKQPSSAQTIVGSIVDIPPLPLPTGETVLQLIIHQNPTGSSSLPVGGLANVAVWAPGIGGHTATTYFIDADGFTIPSGYTFASSNDLVVGQTVQVTVASGSLQPLTAPASLGGWGPPAVLSFTASNLQLEPSQLTGTVSAISSPDFTLAVTYPVPCSVTSSNLTVCPALARLISYDAVTTSQTFYQGFTPDNFSGLEDSQTVSVNGWFFAPNVVSDIANSPNPPRIVAQTVTLHPDGKF